MSVSTKEVKLIGSYGHRIRSHGDTISAIADNIRHMINLGSRRDEAHNINLLRSNIDQIRSDLFSIESHLDDADMEAFIES